MADDQQPHEFHRLDAAPWRRIGENDPQSLVLHSPSLPYIHPVKCDWMYPVQAALSRRVATEDRQRS